MYKYEMHVHTAPCSGGGADIEGHIDRLIEKGFSGIVITNHFYNGDNRIDRSLSWKEFIAPYAEDYMRSKKYGEERDFDVLFGIEEHVGGGKEILVYGITPEFLLDRPELRHGRISDYISEIHSVGGMLFQAHPYRARRYIQSPGPLDELELLDGIEVYNAGNLPDENAAALVLAEKKGLRCIAGSDGHSHDSVGRAGIDSPVRLRSNEELVGILRSGNYSLFKE